MAHGRLTSLLSALFSLSQPKVPSSSAASSSSSLASICPLSGLASHILMVRSVPQDRRRLDPMLLREDVGKVRGDMQRDWMMLLCALGIVMRDDCVGRCHRRISVEGSVQDVSYEAAYTYASLCSIRTAITSTTSDHVSPLWIHLYNIHSIRVPIQSAHEGLGEHPLHLDSIECPGVLPRLCKWMQGRIQIA